MKKKTAVYIEPREARGLLRDVIEGINNYGYARSKAAAKWEYPEDSHPKKYQITVIVERVAA